MSEYRIRVDQVEGFLMTDLARYLERYAKRHLLVRHEPIKANIHYHIWIETDKADSTIRLMLTKHMPYLKGNGGHSISSCDPKRSQEYLQYLFNRKLGNRSYFVSEVGVPDWATFQEKADTATEEFFDTKKGTYSKNDCIEQLCAMDVEFTDHNQIFDHVMTLTKKHKTVFSINAIRDVIIAVGYNSGSPDCRASMRYAVLKVFEPFNG